MRKLINRQESRIFIGVLLLVGIFLFFTQLGVKGFVGFLVGMTVMAVLMLSKNLMIRTLINRFESNEYIDLIKKGK